MGLDGIDSFYVFFTHQLTPERLFTGSALIALAAIGTLQSRGMGSTPLGYFCHYQKLNGEHEKALTRKLKGLIGCFMP